MGVTVFGTTREIAEFLVSGAGVEIRTRGDGRRYAADPVEIGEVALLALTGHGPDGSRVWPAVDGKKVLRAYWFRRPPRARMLSELAARVSAGVGEDRVARELERLAVRFSARPVFGFREEEIRFEAIRTGEPAEGEPQAEENADGGEGDRAGEGSAPVVWLFGRVELAELAREAARAARERLKEEKFRLIGGLGVVATEGGGSGLGLAAGNAGVLPLSVDAVRGLKAFLLRALDQERGGVLRDGALSAYAEGGRLARVLRSGGNFWDAGVVIEVAGRRVRFTSPAEAARLLVFLMD